MAAPIWITPAGDIGTIPDEEFYQFSLDAYNPDGGALEYSVIAGNLPNGLQIDPTGTVSGVPTLGLIEGVPAAISEVTTNTFTVRIKNSQDQISDRSFSLTVVGVTPPKILNKDVSLGTYFEGELFTTQLVAINYLPSATLTWRITSGDLPPGITLSPTGLLLGYIDATSIDFSETYPTKTFQFKVSVSDGVNVDLSTYTIVVVSKSIATADSGDLSADNESIVKATQTPIRPPILRNLDPILDPIRPGGYFYYKFDGYDFDGDELIYSVSGSIPAGLSLDPTSGSLYGFIPDLAISEVNYVFTITVAKKLRPTFFASRQFVIPLLGQVENTVVWITEPNLGVINNGDISTLSVSAYTKSNKSLSYKIVFTDIYNPNFTGSKLPQGLTLLPDGNITGRVVFETYSLDNNAITFDGGKTTFDTEFKFTVEAYNQSPYKVTESGDGQTVVFFIPNLRARTYDTVVKLNGTTLTPGTDFIIVGNTIVFAVAPEENAVIDITLFVNFVSGTREFTVKVNNVNQKPYENLYFKALPSRTSREIYGKVINNSDLIPDEDIYRASDSWFGKNIDLRCLFAAGVNPAEATSYISAMQLNHYWKRISFSNVKTAQALDENFNVKYEVVYVDLMDDLVNEKNQSVSANVAVDHHSGSSHITNVYPNSFVNMRNQIINNIGYANKSILPEWMTSRQPNGKILGFTWALVLVYTKPGKSAAIAYRLNQQINELRKVDFVIDRYEWSNELSKNYSLSNNDYINYLPAQGTITTSSISNTILGSDTVFGTELAAGQTIITADGTRIGIVQAVLSNTIAILSSNAHISVENSVFKHTIGETKFDASSIKTTFDVNQTRFYEYRIMSQDEGAGGQYLKFPNVSIVTKTINS